MEKPRQECPMTVVKATVSKGSSRWEWGQGRETVFPRPFHCSSLPVSTASWLAWNARWNVLWIPLIYLTSSVWLRIRKGGGNSRKFIGQNLCLTHSSRPTHFSRLFTDARHDVSRPGASCYALLCLMSLPEKTCGEMDMTSKQQSPVKLLCVSGSTCDQVFREHEFCLQRKPFGKDASAESNQTAISVFWFVSWQDWAAV